MVKIDPFFVYTLYKSLGTLQGLKPNFSQIKILKIKTVAHTCALVSSNLNPTQSLLQYLMRFVLSVRYPFPVCHLPENDIHSIQSSYFAVLQNKLGFSTKYAQNILFGPKDYGGIGTLDHYIEEESGTVETII